MPLVRIPGTRYFALDWVVQLLIDAGWQESHGQHVRDGHRLYATQLSAWNYSLRGGPAADNPDRPDVYRLPHPKGFGLDIDPSLDWFMQRAGFWRPFYDTVNPATGIKQPRRDEPWHYEPRGIQPFDYPIIRDQPSTSGSGAGTVEEDDMSAAAEQQINEIHGLLAPLREEFIGASGKSEKKKLGTNADIWLVLRKLRAFGPKAEDRILDAGDGTVLLGKLNEILTRLDALEKQLK